MTHIRLKLIKDFGFKAFENDAGTTQGEASELKHRYQTRTVP